VPLPNSQTRFNYNTLYLLFTHQPLPGPPYLPTGCGLRRPTNSISGFLNISHAYEFADREAPVGLPFPESLPAGAYHSAEVDYLFGEKEFYQKLSPAQRQLSEAMIRYWTNFARNSNPNGPGLPEWKHFQKADSIPVVQSLAPGKNGINTVNYVKEHRLAFWRSVLKK
jgi:carboxylesterase type B